MMKNGSPILPGVPCNFRWRVDLDRHHLRYPCALNKDNKRADTSVMPTAVISSLNVRKDKRVANITSFDDPCRDNRESGNTGHGKLSVYLKKCKDGRTNRLWPSG